MNYEDGPVGPCNDCGKSIVRTSKNGGWCDECLRNYKKPEKRERQ